MFFPKNRKITGLLLGAALATAALAEVPYSGEDSDWGVARSAGLVNAYTGNLSFETQDLSLAGAVGRYGLRWSRVATSRDPGRPSFFGQGHNWSHSWQWGLEFSGEGTASAVATVREPSGVAYQFAQDESGAWQPVSPSIKEKLSAEGEGFVLRRLDGMRVTFSPSEDAVGGEGGFVATEIRDPQSKSWTLSYEAGRLTQVTEPAGRTLSLSYETLTSPDAGGAGAQFVVISQVTSSDAQAVQYHYTFPEGVDYPVLTTVTYPDETQASYAYAAPRPGDRLLLQSADDPHADRSIRGRAFVYRTEPEAAFGQLHEIHTLDGDGLFYRLEAEPEPEAAPEARRYAVTLDNGATIHQTYNPGGNLAETIDGSGFSFTTEYDAADGRGQRATETNELGAITTYEHDANGHLSKTTFPDGSLQLQTWDEHGQLLSETDELGNTATFSYDEAGRLTVVTQPDGTTLDISYNALGQVTGYTEPGGAVSGMTYNEQGLLTQATNALGGVTTYEYDAHDRISAVTDSEGHTEQYARDAVGRTTQITHTDGGTVTLEYNAFGQVVHAVDPTGVEEYVKYDSLGRQLERGRAGVPEVISEYAPVGTLAPVDQPVKQLSAMGRAVAMTYDAKGRLTSRTTAANTSVSTTKHMAYDAAGRLVSETDPAGHTVLYGYDARGRRTQTTTALNHTTTVAYDAAGHKLSETDPAGNVTQWTYDPLGHELTKTDANGATTTREYDAAGHLITLIDAKGNAHHFEYDLMGNQTALIYPDGSEERSTYDTSGLKISFTNRAGASQNFVYDSTGREIHSEWSDGTQAIDKTYDLAGRMTMEDNGVSRITFTYDGSGRLASQTQDISSVVSGGAFDPEPRTVTYSYDADGDRTTLGYPDGTFIKFEYEAHGWLSEILSNGNEPPLAHYEYDAVGNPTQMPRENAIVTARAFDEEDHVTSITDGAEGQEPLSQLHYSYDAVGNRTAVERTLNLDGGSPVQTQDTYTYDPVRQVTAAQYGQPVQSATGGAGGTGGAATHAPSSESFSYDALGNRITVDKNGTVTHYTVNALNEYTEVEGFAPSYDANGNLGGMGDWLYQYDSLNRIVSASNGTITAHFWYDARNRVVARSYQTAYAEPPTLTLNTYDDWNLIEERDETGAQKARYVHGPRVDEIVVMTNAHGTFYPQHDALGSVTMLTDAQGHVAERYAYTATGEVTIYDPSGTALPISALGNRWMFTGREFLSKVGLYDYRNRVYSAQLGRFLQTDPIKFRADDLNLYRYVQNDFINYVDPYGDFRKPQWLWHSGEYYLGRCGTFIAPGGIISKFLTKYIPGMYPFAVMHDRFVDVMRDYKSIPDIAYNIPSMAPTFVVAVFWEAVNTVGWLIQKMFGLGGE